MKIYQAQTPQNPSLTKIFAQIQENEYTPWTMFKRKFINHMSLFKSQSMSI